jgi:hypothetical protein
LVSYPTLGTLYELARLYDPNTLSALPAPVLQLPAPATSWSIAAICWIACLGVYQAALHANRSFGEVFKAAFDLYLPVLDKEFAQSGVLQDIAALTNDPALLTRSKSEQRESIWLYLHNYRVRCPHCKESLPAGAVAGHACAAKPPAIATGIAGAP